MPLTYWWEAFTTDISLINKLPTLTLSNMSPFQQLFGQKPDCHFCRTFGCDCFPLLGPYNPHKLDFRSIKCLFIGYSVSHNGYLCLHPSGHVYVSSNVVFS